MTHVRVPFYGTIYRSNKSKLISITKEDLKRTDENLKAFLVNEVYDIIFSNLMS